MKSTLILALGNPLRGDDGIGLAVLEALRDAPLPASLTFLDGGAPGLELPLLMQGYERAILIDAAEMGLRPGEWRRFSPDQVTLKQAEIHGTLHYAGVAEGLALGAALDILPPQIFIYAVQPESIGWEPGLSAPVHASVSAVVEAICAQMLSDF